MLITTPLYNYVRNDSNDSFLLCMENFIRIKHHDRLQLTLRCSVILQQNTTQRCPPSGSASSRGNRIASRKTRTADVITMFYHHLWDILTHEQLHITQEKQAAHTPSLKKSLQTSSTHWTNKSISKTYATNSQLFMKCCYNLSTHHFIDYRTYTTISICHRVNPQESIVVSSDRANDRLVYHDDAPPISLLPSAGLRRLNSLTATYYLECCLLGQEKVELDINIKCPLTFCSCVVFGQQ